MSKRSRIDLAAVADLGNLYRAFRLAARGKRLRPDVCAFEQDLDTHLATLRESILRGELEFGKLHRFRIFDPKPRIIHAPSFRDRVFHHALMAHVGPVLDRALVDDTYACRPGRGALAAVHRVQHDLRRYPWFVKLDVRNYYASIDHAVLLGLLGRRFKNRGLQRLFRQLIVGFEVSPGRGLPIGSLPSQHFANYYLDGLDRLLLEELGVRGHVRYMDDIVFWVESRKQAGTNLGVVECWLESERRLQVRDNPQINRSSCGVTYCGFRVLKGALRLTARRRGRYISRRRAWERAFADGLISEHELQAGFAAVLSGTAHADATAWRRAQLRRNPWP